jgi:predicted nucleic acid-binding protein
MPNLQSSTPESVRRLRLRRNYPQINSLSERRGLPVIGTIGVLREASEMGLLNLRNAFDRLRQTSFHISPLILASLLKDLP